MSFRLPTGYASDVAIDERGAETLRSDIKGRALYKTHELKEIQVPYLSDKEMWERLREYETNTDREETPSVGGDSFIIGDNGIRNKGTTAAKAQPRKRQKRLKNPQQHEGLPACEDVREEKHLLPKRKGKGTGRIRE
jgi:hypothetical protein